MRITDANLLEGLALLELLEQIFQPSCPLILSVNHQLLLELPILAFHRILIRIGEIIVLEFIPNEALGDFKVLILWCHARQMADKAVDMGAHDFLILSPEYTCRHINTERLIFQMLFKL